MPLCYRWGESGRVPLILRGRNPAHLVQWKPPTPDYFPIIMGEFRHVFQAALTIHIREALVSQFPNIPRP